MIRDGVVKQRFFDPNLIEDLLDMQAQIAVNDRDGWDVYFGVLPRVRESGTAADVVEEASVLWADIDAKAMDGGGKQEAFYRINEFVPSPSIVVDSGNGYHAYWLLGQAVEWRQAEAIMRAIAEDLGADHVYDAPRILRVPGTHNHKAEPPIPVRLMRFDRERLYRPGIFADLRDRGIEIMEPPRPASVAFDPESIAATNHQRATPEWLKEKMADTGGEGGRSEHAFSVILWLMRYGWADDEIAVVFENIPNGVGNKFHEKGGPGHPRAIRWLETTMRAARRIA